MSKYVKVMFGTKSEARSDFEYKLNEVNVASNWHPNAENSIDFGGFSYTSEECILRWLHSGDTIYDVEVPKDAENLKLDEATPIYKANKIIISNPRRVDDDLALYYYKISKISKKAYYKSLAVVSIMGYKKTAYQIITDKVGKNNIDEVLEEWNDFIFNNDKDERKELSGLVKEVDEILNEIKSELLIAININKEPYVKDITNDKVINITGESGSGKSYYTNKYKNNPNYIIIDTDEVFSNFNNSTGYNREFGVYLRNKFKKLPSLIDDFDLIYNEILNYFNRYNRTIVIDYAQYRNMKDVSMLKGKIIVMRTCINTCYERCITRWKNQRINYTSEELARYSNKKLGMYSWYKSLNKFIESISKIS